MDNLSSTRIKKILYIQKPLAKFQHCLKDARGLHLLYSCAITYLVPEFESTVPITKTLFFRVPVEDIGDAVFDAEVFAQLLIRYLVLPENIEA